MLVPHQHSDCSYKQTLAQTMAYTRCQYWEIAKLATSVVHIACKLEAISKVLH